jgi:hypothetical protein
VPQPTAAAALYRDHRYDTGMEAVVEALERIEPGGRLVVNAIRKMTDDRAELLRLDYAAHLWMEREVKTVDEVTRARTSARCSPRGGDAAAAHR